MVGRGLAFKQLVGRLAPGRPGRWFLEARRLTPRRQEGPRASSCSPCLGGCGKMRAEHRWRKRGREVPAPSPGTPGQVWGFATSQAEAPGSLPTRSSPPGQPAS